MRTLLLSLCLAALLCLSTARRNGVRDRHTSRCHLNSETGPCRGHFTKWFYNRSTGACQHFVYGGCRGNHNRFNSRQSCERICQATSTSTSQCQLPKSVGRCRAAIPRYYFNSTANRCLRFRYGGCGGNENNFRTSSECRRACPTSHRTPRGRGRVGRVVERV